MDLWEQNSRLLSDETLGCLTEVDAGLYIPNPHAGRTDEWFETIPKDKWVYILMGIENGWEACKLAASIHKNAVVIVIESDPARIKYALSHYDYTEAIKNRQLLVIQSDNKNVINAVLAQVADRLARSIYMTDLFTLRDAEFYKTCITFMNQFADARMLLTATQMRNGGLTCRNLMRCAEAYITKPTTASVRDIYMDTPAVVVSAGPSVDKHLSTLKKYEDKVVVVSCLTMLKPLLAEGITPDYVVALDYHEISAKFFEGIGDSDKDVIYILDPKVNHEVVKACRDRQLYFIGNDWLDHMLGVKGDYMHTHRGSTVAHMAYAVAEHLGCGPIMMIGQDLAFTDGKYYPECVIKAHPWKEECMTLKTETLMPEVDFEGGEVWTDGQMLTYREMFEGIWLNSKVEAIDCTEGGIAKENAKIQPFLETLKELAIDDVDSLEICPIYLGKTAESFTAMIEKGKKIMQNFLDTNGKAISIIDGMESHWKDDAKLTETANIMTALPISSHDFQIAQLLVEYYSGAASIFRTRKNMDDIQFTSDAEKRMVNATNDLYYYKALDDSGRELIEFYDEILDGKG